MNTSFTRRPILMGLATVAAGVMTLAGIENVYAQDKFPSKTINVVTHAGPGGGTDITTRMMMLRGRRVLKQDLQVVSKRGGSGSKALIYANGQKRDGYTIMTITASHLYSIIRGKTPVKVEDLVGLARATDDPQIISVPAKSNIKNIKDLIAASEKAGKKGLKFFFNSMVGIPTVTLGLFLYSLFSKSGPLGSLSLLYTVRGVAVGQAILILPIMVTFIVSAIESKDQELRDLVRTLGASEYETSIAVVREAYSGVSLAIISSFNRAFAELGIATMLGANISGITRVLTTAIALETSKGELGLSFALSFILLFVVLALNYFINWLQGGST